MEDDVMNTLEAPDAPAAEAQNEQVASAGQEAESPVETPTETDEQPLLAGKYRSTEDLERGYKELESKLGLPPEQRTGGGTQQVPAGIPPIGYPPVQNAPMSNDLPFDPETQTALNQWYAKTREAEKAADFQRRHAADLEDRLLVAQINLIMQEENRVGRYVDQEVALERAKDELNKRLGSQAKTIAKEAFNDGQETARAKQKAGAVGDTGTPNPAVDPEKMSAKDFAQYFGIARD